MGMYEEDDILPCVWIGFLELSLNGWKYEQLDCLDWQTISLEMNLIKCVRGLFTNN